MLALSRRPGETVVVDGFCRITIERVQGRSGIVRLIFDAPDSTNIVREELLDGNGMDSFQRVGGDSDSGISADLPVAEAGCAVEVVRRGEQA